MSAPVRRWPLLLIGAPAAVAVWSGWVGLGGLCGFGVIHPLPGIWDALRLNTAITLPVGVEAYGAYALGAWLAPGAPESAKAFARRSAIGALALGMTGQVIYHLLAAAHATRAPWPGVVLVSCIPVITLGFGAALTHLLRAGDGEATTRACPRRPPGSWRSTADLDRFADRPDRYRAGSATGTEPPAKPVRKARPPARAYRSATRRADSPRQRATVEDAEREFGPEIAAGQVPSLYAIRSLACRANLTTPDYLCPILVIPARTRPGAGRQRGILGWHEQHPRLGRRHRRNRRSGRSNYRRHRRLAHRGDRTMAGPRRTAPYRPGPAGERAAPATVRAALQLVARHARRAGADPRHALVRGVDRSPRSLSRRRAGSHTARLRVPRRRRGLPAVHRLPGRDLAPRQARAAPAASRRAAALMLALMQPARPAMILGITGGGTGLPALRSCAYFAAQLAARLIRTVSMLAGIARAVLQPRRPLERPGTAAGTPGRGACDGCGQAGCKKRTGPSPNLRPIPTKGLPGNPGPPSLANPAP